MMMMMMMMMMFTSVPKETIFYSFSVNFLFYLLFFKKTPCMFLLIFPFFFFFLLIFPVLSLFVCSIHTPSFYTASNYTNLYLNHTLAMVQLLSQRGVDVQMLRDRPTILQVFQMHFPHHPLLDRYYQGAARRHSSFSLRTMFSSIHYLSPVLPLLQLFFRLLCPWNSLRIS